MPTGPSAPRVALATVVKVTVVTGLFRRARTADRRPPGGPVVSTIVVVGSVATAAGAADRPGPSSAGSGGQSATGAAIDATQAQVDAVEAQFATQQQSLAQLSEQYDQATVHLRRSTRSCRPPTRGSPSHGRSTRPPTTPCRSPRSTRTSSTRPRASSPRCSRRRPTTSALHDEYQQTAIGNIDTAVTATRRQRDASSPRPNRPCTPSSNRRQASRPRSGTAQHDGPGAAERHRGDAHTGQGSSGATRGTTRRRAGRGGRRRRRGRRQPSRQATARPQAAAQAAQVAADLRGGISGGGPGEPTQPIRPRPARGPRGVIGTGAAQVATGAGAAALHGAETYLGVPYQWGGASCQRPGLLGARPCSPGAPRA